MGFIGPSDLHLLACFYWPVLCTGVSLGLGLWTYIRSLDRIHIMNLCPHGVDKEQEQKSFRFNGFISACECCNRAYGHFGGIGMNRRCYTCQDAEFKASLPKIPEEYRYLSASSGISVEVKVVKRAFNE